MKHDSGQKARDLPVGRQVQGAEISSKVEGRRSKSYRNQPLSAFSFRLSALMQRSRWGIFSGIIYGFVC